MGKDGRKCYVVFTMDCERAHPGKAFYPAGPRHWKESGDNIAAFCEILFARNIYPNLFATPEACENHKELFRDLCGIGCEIGLHLHPRTFEYGVNEYLGLLPYRIQRELLERAKSKCESVLRQPIKTFRAGFYSANNDTFTILRSLGFTHTSTSVARRHNPNSGALWGNTLTYPHLILGIREVPVTSHPTRNLPNMAYEIRAFIRKLSLIHQKRSFGRHAHSHLNQILKSVLGIRRGAVKRGSRGAVSPCDFQIEHRDFLLLKSIIDAYRIEGNDYPKPLPTIVCTTHNDVPFGVSSERYIKRLKRIVDYLECEPCGSFCYSSLTRLPDSCYIGAAED